MSTSSLSESFVRLRPSDRRLTWWSDGGPVPSTVSTSLGTVVRREPALTLTMSQDRSGGRTSFANYPSCRSTSRVQSTGVEPIVQGKPKTTPTPTHIYPTLLHPHLCVLDGGVHFGTFQIEPIFGLIKLVLQILRR